MTTKPSCFERVFVFLHPLTKDATRIFRMQVVTVTLLMTLILAFENLAIMVWITTRKSNIPAFVLAVQQLGGACIGVGIIYGLGWFMLSGIVIEHVCAVIKVFGLAVPWIVMDILQLTGATDPHNPINFPEELFAAKGVGMALGVFFIVESLVVELHVALSYRCVRISEETSWSETDWNAMVQHQREMEESDRARRSEGSESSEEEYYDMQ